MSKKKNKQTNDELFESDYFYNEPKLIAEGIPLAMLGSCSNAQLVGIPPGDEGHTLIFGGTGSGKSTGPVMAALRTWKGTVVVTDPKGELYAYYKVLYDNNLVARRPILFDPTQETSVRYDPFWFIAQDEADLIGNVTELVHTIFPTPPDCREPYWIETEQAVLEAGIIYYYRLGLSFSKTITALMSATLAETIETLNKEGDILIKMIVGSMADLKSEELASHDRGFRNKLKLFAADARINNAFDCIRAKDDNCFCWDDLNNFNVFICISEERIMQWSALIRMMTSQLFSYLERKPESSICDVYSPVLLLMDEFARFGKIEGITNALCTLRSKNVHIVLSLQSLAQLDKHYGVDERRVICDNCQYKLVLQASDPDTQKLLSDLVGVRRIKLHSQGKSMNNARKVVSYSKQKSETYLPLIFPHEFSTLTNAILLSPFGVKKLKKLSVYNMYFEDMLESNIISVASL